MIFRKMDMISPPITIFYKGDSSHSSIFSGILTIIVYALCLGFGIQYGIRFIKHQNPKVYYYNRYVEDAGEFPLNSSMLFTFIQFLETSSNSAEIIDFDSIRIVGIEETINLYEDNHNLSNYNHWLYGPCNNYSDTQGISELINFEYFTDSACIRYYYNKDHQKYYSTEDSNFKWPVILHGCSHPNRTFYGIIIEKCMNDTLRSLITEKHCKTYEAITSYIKTSSVNLKMLDNYADVLNYEKPFIKYFYSLSHGLFEESYTTNHLNFNPITLITNDAIFVDNQKETLSYYFEQNEKTTGSSKETGIYVAFYFWMQNKMQYYERQYSKFQDALSDIGGIGSLLLTLSYFINFLVSNFMILSDTEGLLNEIESSKKFDQSILNNNIYKNLIEKRKRIKIEFPPKKHLSNRSNIRNYISKIGLINEEDEQNNRFEDIKESIHFKNKNDYKQIIQKKKTFNKQINILNLNEKSQEEIINEEKNSDNKKNIRNDKSDLNIRGSNTIKKETHKKIGFFDYIAYMFTYKKFKKRINCYEEFRCRIISEENLILSYLNICKILKLIKKIKEGKDKIKFKGGMEEIVKIIRSSLKHKTIKENEMENPEAIRKSNKSKTICYNK